MLVVERASGGPTYRFLLSTLSWFDLVTRRALPRPDLATLCARLNELEGSDPAGELAWRSQDVASPTPELWFGTADLEHYAEHSPALRASRLEPGNVRGALVQALRESWTFPE